MFAYLTFGNIAFAAGLFALAAILGVLSCYIPFRWIVDLFSLRWMNPDKNKDAIVTKHFVTKYSSDLAGFYEEVTPTRGKK